MVGLGTLDDKRPEPTLQPKPLVDAIHLRWACGPGLGYPWYGFFLFRRPSRGKEDRRCLRGRTSVLKVGAHSSTFWNSGIGIVSSDTALFLRDDFPPPAEVEFDLDNRQYLDFTPSDIAYGFELTIGFRKFERRPRTCLHFDALRPQHLPNPFTHLNFSLTTFNSQGKKNEDSQVIETTIDGSEKSALLLSKRTDVRLDSPAEIIEISLVARGGVACRGTDAAGKKVEGKDVSVAGSEIQQFRLEGEGLQQVVIEARGEAFLLSVCAEGKSLRPLYEVKITAYSGNVEVAHTTVSGEPGMVVPAALFSDSMDRLRISSAHASLIDLCWYSVNQSATVGWRPVEKIKQPIALPVRHPDYPASGNLPTDPTASWNDANARISYGDPNDWAAPFPELHTQCVNLVQGGPPIPMNSPFRAVTFPAVPEPGDTATPPKLPSQHPLHLTLLASMHAPLAQILGLYWSDQTAVVGQTYDYLIVADHLGKGSRDAQKVASIIGSNGFTDLDGFIVFGKRVEPAVPLDPPTDARVFALPGTTRPLNDGSVEDASCNSGLIWDLPVINNVLLPESPVLYHMWRTKYGDSKPNAPADAKAFDALTEKLPVLIVENLLSTSGVQRPQDWPPFPLYGFDNGVDEGWYGYRLSNIDLFGRHSALSQDARWFEWTPVPDPRPWYYVNPPANASINPFAVALLDKMSPPPPTGTEAFALDPKDPYLQKDTPYDAWFGSLSAGEKTTVIGLRVRWNWTEAHMRQAPDTKEFRIYYQDGRLNTLLGQTTSVSVASATESVVQTDIPNSHPADTFVGCSLRIGPNIFTIVGNSAGASLRLRVKNVGPADDVRPPERANCEVNIPNNHPLFVNYGEAHPWGERIYVVGYNDHVSVGVDGAGRPIRRYEVFLPASGDTFRGGLPLNPDLAEPIKFAAIGVTAADSRTHTADDPKWATGRWGARTGNESSMSPPGIVFRVLREKPTPPAPPPDSERVYATAADYHAASFYTFRWARQAHLKTHVYRAMDDTIFNVDWSYRPRLNISGSDLAYFPSEAAEPRWDSLKRQQVADELNVLNTFAKTPAGKALAKKYYRGLSNDGLRVLANMPSIESAFAQITITALDPDDPSTANRVGPDNPPDFVVDPNLRIYIDTLDGRSTNRFFYKACYIDGAQNRSVLSQSGPPIWLPNVVPPKPPTLTKVLAGDADPMVAGDRKITLGWASNREEDLAEYRVYRAMSEADARSVRSMTLVHTHAVAAGDPELRPGENVWTDSGLTPREDVYYCLVAVDVAGNVSPPTEVRKGRAFDDTRPDHPTWAPAVMDGDIAKLSWTSPVPDLRCLVQRHQVGVPVWEEVGTWLPRGTYAFNDDKRKPGRHYVYRLRVLDSAGRSNGAYTELTV